MCTPLSTLPIPAPLPCLLPSTSFHLPIPIPLFNSLSYRLSYLLSPSPHLSIYPYLLSHLPIRCDDVQRGSLGHHTIRSSQGTYDSAHWFPCLSVVCHLLSVCMRALILAPIDVYCVLSASIVGESKPYRAVSSVLTCCFICLTSFLPSLSLSFLISLL